MADLEVRWTLHKRFVTGALDMLAMKVEHLGINDLDRYLDAIAAVGSMQMHLAAMQEIAEQHKDDTA